MDNRALFRGQRLCLELSPAVRSCFASLSQPCYGTESARRNTRSLSPHTNARRQVAYRGLDMLLTRLILTHSPYPSTEQRCLKGSLFLSSFFSLRSKVPNFNCFKTHSCQGRCHGQCTHPYGDCSLITSLSRASTISRSVCLSLSPSPPPQTTHTTSRRLQADHHRKVTQTVTRTATDDTEPCPPSIAKLSRGTKKFKSQNHGA